ncbi:MAG: CDP-diacylglycerol--serine O-phosphatidyltransferase [Pseudonocardiaceae bacterium]
MPNPGVRLLPNAITVLALCAGLSAVYFTLNGNTKGAVGAIALAALLDSLDGRLARMLDATSRIGAELDSLADCISFGVAPAVVLFIWGLDGTRLGWPVALVFAVCVVLRLARFNTLLDDAEAPPFAKEFFVGVPSPAGALLALLPLTISLQFGEGWWSSPITVAVWTVAIAVMMVSRMPTLSAKTVQVPAKAVAPLLVLIAGLAATVLTFPFGSLAMAMLLYMAHLPYANYRYRWLEEHPSAWEVPPRQRRAIRRTARTVRRLGLRPPLRRRVAGAAARAGAAVRRRRTGEVSRTGESNGQLTPGRRSRRVGLRRH